MSHLLIAEPPLIVIPSLADAIGLNEAIVLQQIHFWIVQSVNEYDGHKWTYRTDQQWLDVFSFWSESTLRRAVTKLKKLGLIRVEKLSRHFGGNSFDRKNYYTVIYSSVDALPLKPSNRASGQNDQMESSGNLEVSNDASGQNDQMEGSINDEASNDASSQNDHMEAVKMNTSSSQDDQFRSSQDDQFRSSQDDQMFKENKKDYYRESEEAAPAPSLFAVDLKPASALSKRDAFSMHFEWKPSESFFDRCKVQGIRLDLFSNDEQEQVLGEFRSYWEAKGAEENQGSWEHKLCNQIKRRLVDKASTRSNIAAALSDVNNSDWTKPQTKKEVRSNVTAAVMDVGNTNW